MVRSALLFFLDRRSPDQRRKCVMYVRRSAMFFPTMIIVLALNHQRKKCLNRLSFVCARHEFVMCGGNQLGGALAIET